MLWCSGSDQRLVTALLVRQNIFGVHCKKKTVIAGSPRYPENGMSSLDQKHGIVK
jgi:hypothetical protein